jgi:hypothetical protein
MCLGAGIRAMIVAIGLWCMGTAQAASTPLLKGFSLASWDGFCPDGAWRLTSGKPEQLKIFGSYCGAGDSVVGAATTITFPAPRYLALYLAGYPNGTDLALFVENTATHQRYPLMPGDQPGDRWQRVTFALPSAWRGQPIVLKAEDRAATVHGWLAFTEPVREASEDWGTGDMLSILVIAILHFVVLALPPMAVCTWLVRRNMRNVVTLTSAALIAIGAVGYVGFLVFLLSPELGAHYGVDIAIGSAIVFSLQFRGLNADQRSALRPLLLPALLVGTVAILVLSAGFLYGGTSSPFDTAFTRFSHKLPPDNEIPFLFAEHLHAGQIPHPLLGDWLTSDRPPLQTGIVLSQYVFMGRKVWAYTVLSVILQSLWILGAWSILQSFRVDRRAMAMALGVATFSGFVFVNTFFVWPKLLAAAFLLALAAHLRELEKGRTEEHPAAAWMAAALGGLAMLSHGGSAFALMGISAVTIFAGRRFLSRRFLVVSAVGLLLINLPWSLYQKLLDPPGDRLLKEHLAGVLGPNQRPFLDTLISSYAHVGFAEALHNKLENIAFICRHAVSFWGDWVGVLTGSDPASGPELRTVMFYHFFPALGFMGFGLAALAIGLRARKRSVEWRAAARMWLFVGVTDLFWVLLMFGPASTSTHQGTYFTMILGFVAGALALWSVWPRMAWTLTSVQAILHFWLYVMATREPEAGTLLQGTATPSVAVLMVAAVAATLAILGRIGYANFPLPHVWIAPAAPRHAAAAAPEVAAPGPTEPVKRAPRRQR